MKKCNCPYFESNCGGIANDELNCICPKYKAYIATKDEKQKEEMIRSLGVTSTTKFGKMYQLQSVFAQKFHNINNLSESEINKWINEYLVCIEDEILEAYEFLDVYEEKIKDFNIKEYRKELIDIIHFLMDAMLVSGITEDYLIEKLDDKEVLDKIYKNCEIKTNLRYEDTLNYLLRDLRLTRQHINWKHWKKEKPLNIENIRAALLNMYKHLIMAFKLSGMTVDDIYNVYIDKNVENQFRQKFGYGK